jgi:hypothetical protein
MSYTAVDRPGSLFHISGLLVRRILYPRSGSLLSSISRVWDMIGHTHSLRAIVRVSSQLYQIHGNVIYVAMSADASCRGLMSPMDGPVRMEFTEGMPE